MDRRVNERQLEVLRWIGEGCPVGKWPDDDFTYKTTSVALHNRKLIDLHRRGPNWSASITAAGTHYLEHGEYPQGHKFSNIDMTKVSVAVPPTAVNGQLEWKRGAPEPVLPPPLEFEIDSPKRLRQRDKGGTQADSSDPWDEKILVSVKEAAWLLSMSEGMIRAAVRDGDIHRVFIGMGTTNYRIVYRSLLAWVNDFPRDPNDRWKTW